MGRVASQLLAGGIALATLSNAVSPVEVQRQNFVNTGTGDRFEIIGIDYQPGGEAGFDPTSGEDPLSNAEICLRDAALMQQLGINTIRTYNVDPYISHDECASIFNEVGIYMLVDVNSPLEGDSINRADPESSYNLAYLNRTFAVIESFRNYPNLIGFMSGNEIINDMPTARVDPPYIRAVTRDLKQYIAARGGRSLPVGYAAADFREVLVDTSSYLQCTIQGEGDVDSRSDFFALNSYSWCGAEATFESATYDVLAADFASTTIPVFFGEFGCIIPKPRVFNEIAALYGPRMTTWSGGLVYQWTEEGSPEGEGYGLVNINTDGGVELTTDYNNLQTQYSQLDFDLITQRNATARNLQPPQCSEDLIENSYFSTEFELPEQPDGVQRLINNGVQAATGSIVSVTRTTVDVMVTQANGQTSSGLTITRASSANRPTAPPSMGGSSGGSSATGTGNAAPRATGQVGVATSPVVGFWLASLLLWFL